MDQSLQPLVNEIINKELHFHFAKSGGHGGQNVNKRETKAELYFNIHDSKFLDEKQKQRLIQLGGQRIHHHEGILIMTCQEERYQHANKKKVIHHFTQLLQEALTPPTKRIPTNIPRAVKQERLSEKKIQSEKKQRRSSAQENID